MYGYKEKKVTCHGMISSLSYWFRFKVACDYSYRDGSGIDANSTGKDDIYDSNVYGGGAGNNNQRTEQSAKQKKDQNDG